MTAMTGLIGLPRRILGSVRWRWRNLVSRVRFRRATRLVSGNPRVRLADDECCAVLLMKDGAWYIPELLAHHRAIGVTHFLVIDNGSSDETQSLLAREPDVTVIENRLPVGEYEVLMRSRLPRRFVTGGWFLVVDSDEMFDPPPGCGGRIGPLLRYMDSEGQTAMLAHALDMFSREPATVTAGWSFAEAIARLDRYSLGQLQRIDYHDPGFPLYDYVKDNVLCGPQHFWRGGMRLEVFGEAPILTRHNLIRNAPGVAPPGHVHAVSKVRVSEVTAAFRHYKFAGDYIARDRKQVAARIWAHGEDAQRTKLYDRPGGFAIGTSTDREYLGSDDLLDAGFIQTSEKFRDFVSRDPEASGSAA